MFINRMRGLILFGILTAIVLALSLHGSIKIVAVQLDEEPSNQDQERKLQCGIQIIGAPITIPSSLCGLVGGTGAIAPLPTLNPPGPQTGSPSGTPTGTPTSLITNAPTSSTNSPTDFTSAPTDFNPSTVIQTSCSGASGTSVQYGSHVSLFRLGVTSTDNLCTLTVKTTNAVGKETMAPVARSYDGSNWENVAGPYAITITCNGSVCDCQTPTIDPSSQVFLLTSYSVSDLKSEDVAARFFEQTTFGITQQDIAPWYNLDVSGLHYKFAQWIKNQIDSVPSTSLRQVFRKEATTSVRTTKNHGVPVSLCDENTRWHSYALTRTDGADAYKFLNITRTSDGQYYLFTINGVPRTEVESVEVDGYGDLAVPGTYEFCKFWQQTEHVGGSIVLNVDGRCRNLKNGNPKIQFLSSNPEKPPNIIPMSSPSDISLFQPLPGTVMNDEFILPSRLSNVDCSTVSFSSYPILLDFGDGNYLSFDPRLTLLENTVENPLIDGGGANHLFGARCSNAPRTFLNEEKCKLSSTKNVCSNEMVTPDANILMTQDNLYTLFQLTSRYLYVIQGLRVETSPCVTRSTSRWKKVSDTATCPDGGETVFSDQTKATLSLYLGWSTEWAVDDNNRFRDIVKYNDGRQCNVAASTPSYVAGSEKDIMISRGDSCWKLVHVDENSIYDMTRWVDLHPGGASKIIQFAVDGGMILTYPHPGDMTRWEDNKKHFNFAGLFNQNSTFHSLPGMVQLPSVIDHYNLESVVGENVIVCGSPNEGANTQILGATGIGMSIGDGAEDLIYGEKLGQRQIVWLRTMLTASDQLRQRVAWALRQKFATSPETVLENEQTEGFLYFYDIFVRHAFGNYYDILKEVAYSPHMAEMLTFLRSQSTEYVLRTYNLLAFADENFAREVMQLFTVGLTMLNMDGSPIKDPVTGHEILTYENEHVMSYARAWTGFDRQFGRGNIELSGGNPNRIDPMQLHAEWRDVYPKINLENGYIGDGYPLCVDLPDKEFLRKGAKYRLLGSSNKLQLNTEPPHWENYDPMVKNVKLDPSSSLYNALCNPSSPGGNDCDFKVQVEITENLSCFGLECDVDTLHLLEVTDGTFFEYVRQPCVELTYYQNPRSITHPYRRSEMCADPKTAAAREACCTAGDQYSRSVQCQYSNERVKFQTASDRCSAIGQSVCPFTYVLMGSLDAECGAYNHMPHWHDSDCVLQAKINTGLVSMVHKPTDMINQDIKKPFRDDNLHFFSVHWTSSDYPNAANLCGNYACVVKIDGCLCDTRTVESAAFSSRPADLDRIISTLKIGSVSPDTFDANEYSVGATGSDFTAYFKNGASYDIDTIFEVVIHSETKYYKNMISTVEIVGNNGEIYSFRNPPHFMNFVRADERDAHYETEAVLKSYFYHQNVAPKLAEYLIQRFGVSNPSPRYIEAVALAFKNGHYTFQDITYGTNKYGDMQSTIAAVLLDDEARSPVLKKDPSMGSFREPLLKVVNFMRSLNYTAFEFFNSMTHSHRLGGMTSKIGQMVFEMKDIFSFYNSDYSPVGEFLDASLKAPEFQTYMAPSVIGIMNGLFSMAKYGLAACSGGFGSHRKWCGRSTDGDWSYGYGNLQYTPADPTDNEGTVNELATMLTAGRLNEESRQIIKEKMDEETDPAQALRVAEQLIAATPEFHSTSEIEFTGEDLPVPETPTPSSKHFKAVVYFFANGGLDTYNMLVPHSDCVGGKDMYQEYATVRSSVAINKNRLLQIGTGGEPQVCNKFGINPDLSFLKQLYDDTDLTFFANVGILFEEVTKDDWLLRTPTQLFAHNTQQKDTQQLDPYLFKLGTGVLGRMSDALTSKGFKVGSYSITPKTFALVGEPEKSPGINFVSHDGLLAFNDKPSIDNMDVTLAKLNRPLTSSSGLYGKKWTESFEESIRQTNDLYQSIGPVSLSTNFPNSRLGKSLKQVATIIKAKDTLGQDRQFFHVESGGFDTHSGQNAILGTLNRDINDCIKAFTNEMKAQGKWDNVVFVLASDFGRTLVANTGGGTDHAWGGNYFTLGGSMNGHGGKILGTYPDDLTEDGPLNIGQGRLIPSTSWDSIINAVAEWTGINEEEDLNSAMPNRLKFEVFTREEFFADDPTPPPTGAPTLPPAGGQVLVTEIISLTNIISTFLSSFLSSILGGF